MKKRIQILLQTTIPAIEDDWNINRFSLLRDHLSSLTDGDGQAIFALTARDRGRVAQKCRNVSVDRKFDGVTNHMTFVVVVIGMKPLLFIRVDDHLVVVRKRGPVSGGHIISMTAADEHSSLQNQE